MDASIVPYPAAPDEPPSLSGWDTLLRTVLPATLRPGWKLDHLFACDLRAYEPSGSRDDVHVEWLRSVSDLHPNHERFMVGHTGRAVWLGWKHRLRRRYCELALGRMEDQIVHSTFVTQAGPGMRPYGPIMRPRTALVGPCFTAPAWRGKRIYPYVLSRVLLHLKRMGCAWALIHSRIDNVASERGIRQCDGWVYVGRFLLRRPPFGRHRIVGATLTHAEPTVFGSGGEQPQGTG